MKNPKPQERPAAMVTEADLNATEAARFWSKVAKSEGCWEWHGAKTNSGYGRIVITRPGENPRQVWFVAHRVAWALAGKSRAGDQILCHRCDNPGCVNPEHLFVGTHKDNAADRDAKGRRTPPKGIKNGRAKLTEQDVRDIRANKALCRVTHAELAARFGISQSQVGYVLNHGWRNI